MKINYFTTLITFFIAITLIDCLNHKSNPNVINNNYFNNNQNDKITVNNTSYVEIITKNLNNMIQSINKIASNEEFLIMFITSVLLIVLFSYTYVRFSYNSLDENLVFHNNKYGYI